MAETGQSWMLAGVLALGLAGVFLIRRAYFEGVRASADFLARVMEECDRGGLFAMYPLLKGPISVLETMLRYEPGNLEWAASRFREGVIDETIPRIRATDEYVESRRVEGEPDWSAYRRGVDDMRRLAETVTKLYGDSDAVHSPGPMAAVDELCRLDPWQQGSGLCLLRLHLVDGGGADPEAVRRAVQSARAMNDHGPSPSDPS